MSQFRRRLLMMMQTAQDIWRDVVLTGIGLVVANDTTAGQPLKIFPQGWTEQNSYDGNNFINYLTVDLGLLVYNTGNVVKQQYTQYYYSDYVFLNPGSYIIKMYGYGSSLYSFAKYDNDKQYIGGNYWGTSTEKAFTVEEEMYVRFAFKSEPLTDITNDYVEYAKNAKIMLNKGSTALPYEPYTGGQPSPSPEYPQPILNAGTYNEETGKYEYQLNIFSGNYFDIDKIPDKTVGQSYILNNDDGSITVKTTGYVEAGTISDFVAGIIPNRQYIIDAETTGDKPYFAIKTSATLRVYYGDAIVFTEDVINGLLYVYGDSSGEPCIVKNISVREVSVTDYVPYQSPQSITLTSDRPLTKWDRLVYKDGQIGWEYGGEKTIVDGSQSISIFGDGFAFLKSDNWDKNANSAFCDKLIRSEVDSDNPRFWEVYGNLNYVYTFSTSSVYGTTVTEIKENLALNPLTFWHESLTPTYIPLSESEQQALNALTAYYPTTVFSNDQNGFMQIEYRTKYGGDA